MTFKEKRLWLLSCTLSKFNRHGMGRGDSIARERAYNLSQALRYCGAGVEKCHVKNKEGRDKSQEINGTFFFFTLEVVSLPLSRRVVCALQWSLKVMENNTQQRSCVGWLLVSRKRGML